MPIRRPDHGCHGYSSSQNSVPWAFSSLVVQHDQAPRLNRIQATSTRGVRARIRRVAGCAPPTGSAGHAGATANLKLTFHLGHSAGADHPHRRLDHKSLFCCGAGDVVKTKFMVELGGDRYPDDVWYAWLNHTWTKIPPEKIVKDYAPDDQAHLFVLAGTIQCFVRPKGGI